MRMFLLYVCTVHNNARFIFVILRVRDFSADVVKRVGAKFLDDVRKLRVFGVMKNVYINIRIRKQTSTMINYKHHG